MTEHVTQQNLEAFFHKKILLYRSLLDCLKKERDHLVNLDLDGLWDISRVKDELCARITSVRQQISAAIKTGAEQRVPSFNEMIAAVPTGKKESFQRLFSNVGVLKREVEAYRKENVAFINDSLRFIDELILNITGSPQTRNVYDNRCRLKKTGSRMLLAREA